MSPANTIRCLDFHRAYVTLRLSLDEALGQFHGIDFDDFALLHSLAGTSGSPASLGVLASELGTSRLMMLRRMRPLAKIGLLALLGGVTDRRVELQPAGLSLVNVAQDTVAHVCSKTLASRSTIDPVASVDEGRARA